MKKIFSSLIAIAFAINFSYAQWTGGPTGPVYYNGGNVGIGTTIPQASLDVAKLLSSGEIGSILGRLPEGTGTGMGTYLGITGYDTQLTNGNTDWNTVKSFAIEHGFYGYTNSSINFFRGGGYFGGSISFNTNNNTEAMRIASTGNVGIGTTSPTSRLYIAGGGRNGLKIDDVLDGTPTSKYLSLWQGTGAIGIDAIGTGIIYLGYDQPADIRFGGSTTNGIWKANGNVGIGTTSPDANLAVNGTIHAKEVKVDLSVPGPDYVFEPAYKLATLSELKAYVDQNHHLPEIPSAAQMAKDGLNLGDMNTKLLKKVEELTLYLIRQQDEIKELKKLVEHINNQQKPN